MNSLVLPPLPDDPKVRRFWRTAPGSAHALVIAESARRHSGLVLAVTRDTHAAHTLESDLKVFVDKDIPVLHFPDWETLPYDLFAPHPEIISQRIATLYRLPSLFRGVLVVPVATLTQRLPPPQFIHGAGLMLHAGQALQIHKEQQRLQSAGYRHVSAVVEPGEFSVRGGLMDIFPMGSMCPYRIELLDEEIDSIRSFDPETQRSKEKVESVNLLPAREFPLTETSIKAFRNTLRERFPIDPRRCPIYQDIREGFIPAGIEYYLPLFFEKTVTLFDYLPSESLCVLAEGVLDATEQFTLQTQQRYEQRAHDIERPVLPPEELYLTPQQLREQFNKKIRVEFYSNNENKNIISLDINVAPIVPLNRKGEPTARELKHFLEFYPGRVLIAADSAGRRESLLEQLHQTNIHIQSVHSWQEFLHQNIPLAIVVASLDDGFALTHPAITVFTERQLLGEKIQQARRRKRVGRDPDTIIRDLTDLAIGAPVVHADHGVGRYQGLIKLDISGSSGEFLAIEYAKGDKLYVPVAQLQLVSRYTGTSPELAPLHSLGSEQWAKAKRKAAEKVRDVAAELLALYAKREARPGHSMSYDRTMYEQFTATFPFEETPDQLNAIQAVLADLASNKPMDRVVCGDVGFGKTEVALRAAFVAAIAGKQVALLVPTTLLAQQHYQNFRDRFADWPIRVEVLSRFKSKKEIENEIHKLAEGTIDVVIGTHRLLQGDIRFKNLGLIIIDEEHRFGVKQKEQLKKLRAEVDLLTLTATPIPRTLNMSMNGLRDLSIIATPPAHRMAVKTFITPYDPAQIREAFQRELARGGQVYFLHNDVETIEKTVRELEILIPEARIRFAHGQMPERELEQTMLDFYRQRFNVLVCTTIIESGIDIPTANTIIIHRADRFGLAQLHQLRGRVGRSQHRAYAYLIVPDKKVMTADAEKRLEAIASLEDLGAGFTLATHDLEIRGAGELLGEDQSGQIEEIGFSLYTELLERAVKALKLGEIPDFDLKNEHDAEIELHIAALIPEDYLPDVHTRLTLYKRIASAQNEETLRELQIEMIDRFGLMPDPVKNLFAITQLKLMATPLGIRKLDCGPQGGRILFNQQPNINPTSIIKLIQAQPKIYSLDGPEKLRIRMEMPDPLERLRKISELLLLFST